MRIRAARDYGHDSRHAKFGTFLNRPLHAVELEYGEQQRNVCNRNRRYFFAQFELNPTGGNGYDAPPPQGHSCRDIEFLTDTRPQHSNQMICVIARKRGAVARDFVGDPSASGHFSRGNGTRDFA
jgi:hypothetical protein